MSAVTAAQLLQMSPGEMRKRGLIHMEGDLTDEDWEILRLRVQEYDREMPLDVNALTQKLANIDQTRPASRSPTPLWDLEAARPGLEEREYDAYEELIADGGIPTHHPSTTNEQLYAVANKGVIQYWRTEHGSDTVHYTLSSQARAWRDFRREQDKSRNDKSMTFAEYKSKVKTCRAEWGLVGDTNLQRVRQEQTQLDNFKEWQYLEYRYRNYYRQKMERAAKRDERVWDKLEQATLDTGSIFGSYKRVCLLTDWIGEQVARLEEERAEEEKASAKASEARMELSVPLGDGTLRKRMISETEPSEETDNAQMAKESGPELGRRKRARSAEEHFISAEAEQVPAQQPSKKQRTRTAAVNTMPLKTIPAAPTTKAVKARSVNEKRKRVNNDSISSATRHPRRSSRIANLPQVKYPK